MSKPKQVATTENQYKEWTPSNTPDIQNVRDFQDTPESLAPSLQAQYDRAQQRNASRLNSSYNQNIPQSARLAMQQQGDRDMNADYGAALGQSAYTSNQAKLARQMGLAEMTMGKPLQSKSTQTQEEKGGTFGKILGGALGMASSFI
jgi:hypothetical protein